MKRLSISQAWDEARAFLSRERRLVVPVLLAFVVLPAVLLRTLVPQAGDLRALLAGEVPTWAGMLNYAVLFLQFVGAATLILLALGRREPLGRLIMIGAGRTLVLLLAFLLFGLLAVPALVLLTLTFAVSGGAPPDPASIPPGLVLAMGLFGVLLMLLLFRMILLIPAIVAEPIGPWTGLRRGWGLGRGNGGRLIATFALILVASLVLNLAIGSVVATLARLVLGSTSGATVGGLLLSVSVALVAAAVLAVQNAMLAMLYRQAS